MKLKELRTVLRAENVNLYAEKGKVIKYEIWGLDDAELLSEYRMKDELESKEGDTMFFKYGDYNVDEIATEDDGTLYIAITN